MRIIARKTLKAFWASYPDAEQPLKAWFKSARQANWKTPQDVKALYRNATILQNGRVVFNIAGNKYRLVAWINYAFKVVYVRFVGTHKQYDEIDVQTV
jgi:mRNA interferase HigB